MIDLPEFSPLEVSQSARAATREVYESFDHVAIVLPSNPGTGLFRSLPQGKQLRQLLTQAARRDVKQTSSRLDNARGTGITAATFDESTAFATLTWARQVIAECLRDRPRRLGVVALGLGEEARARALLALVAAAEAAAFELPSFKTKKPAAPRLGTLRLLAQQPRLDLRDTRAASLGNNIARWFTALPPNELTAATYRDAIEKLVKRHGIRSTFLSERELERLGAGAFLAVAQGNATRDAGMLRLTYRPPAQRAPAGRAARQERGAHAGRPVLTLVGKGILFDTGGTNLKPFKGMLDMHTDMQGSAIALGCMIALAELETPYAIDAWLALTENRLSARAYKSQDVVRAANGTSIQVIHTDAEGRMALADALALAARDKPKLMIDYATLTGTCVTALTERYSGVFSNRSAAGRLLTEAGAASGERVWPFPLDEDFDEALRSEVADVKQCAVDGQGDHIVAARFLNRFVPSDIAWVHVDLSAGQHKGGLAHIPTEITGFGVRFTLELLRNRADGAADLAAKLAS
jgi:leucyl aminopeptidase